MSIAATTYQWYSFSSIQSLNSSPTTPAGTEPISTLIQICHVIIFCF